MPAGNTLLGRDVGVPFAEKVVNVVTHCPTAQTEGAAALSSTPTNS